MSASGKTSLFNGGVTPALPDNETSDNLSEPLRRSAIDFYSRSGNWFHYGATGYTERRFSSSVASHHSRSVIARSGSGKPSNRELESLFRARRNVWQLDDLDTALSARESRCKGDSRHANLPPREDRKKRMNRRKETPGAPTQKHKWREGNSCIARLWKHPSFEKRKSNGRKLK